MEGVTEGGRSVLQRGGAGRAWRRGVGAARGLSRDRSWREGVAEGRGYLRNKAGGGGIILIIIAETSSNSPSLVEYSASSSTVMGRVSAIADITPTSLQMYVVLGQLVTD